MWVSSCVCRKLFSYILYLCNWFVRKLKSWYLWRNIFLGRGRKRCSVKKMCCAITWNWFGNNYCGVKVYRYRDRHERSEVSDKCQVWEEKVVGREMVLPCKSSVHIRWGNQSIPTDNFQLLSEATKLCMDNICGIFWWWHLLATYYGYIVCMMGLYNYIYRQCMIHRKGTSTTV